MGRTSVKVLRKSYSSRAGMLRWSALNLVTCHLSPMRLATWALLLHLAMAEEKKKKKFMANYSGIFKMALFWWTIVVFVVMGVYILDTLLTRWFGPARVDWAVEHTFPKAVAGRESYWAQLADPSKWSATHPVMQGADISMVELEPEENRQALSEEDMQKRAGEYQPEPRLTSTAVALQAMKPGLGLLLRHKKDASDRAGSFFCIRECTKVETEGDVWRLITHTVDVGGGYPFHEGSEVTELQMWPPTADGLVACKMTSCATVSSRFFRWWTGLLSASRSSGEAVFEAIEREVKTVGKKD